MPSPEQSGPGAVEESCSQASTDLVHTSLINVHKSRALEGVASKVFLEAYQVLDVESFQAVDMF